MAQESSETGIGDGPAGSLVSAVRTSVGDTLRSVIYFTPSAFDVLYVRADLYDSPAAAREAKAPLVELEQVGFAEGPVRTELARREGRSEIGPYEFTVRFHDDGFVVRLLEDDVGVLFTADAMDARAFEEATVALRGLLGEHR